MKKATVGTGWASSHPGYINRLRYTIFTTKCISQNISSYMVFTVTSPVCSFYQNQSFPTGPSAPLQPSNLVSTGVTHNRATILWTVSRIAYTPETYTVHFGTSPGSLTPFSQQRQSGDSFTATNLQFSLQLTGLSAGSTYYYQVVAVNSVGSNQSTMQQFRTNELRKLICFVHAIPIVANTQCVTIHWTGLLDWTTFLPLIFKIIFYAL